MDDVTARRAEQLPAVEQADELDNLVSGLGADCVAEAVRPDKGDVGRGRHAPTATGAINVASAGGAAEEVERATKVFGGR